MGPLNDIFVTCSSVPEFLTWKMLFFPGQIPGQTPNYFKTVSFWLFFFCPFGCMKRGRFI